MVRLGERHSPRDDRRSRRTQRLLGDALVDLMQEKRYDTITVQEIIDRANVGRSTFYAHYLDKEDLLQHQVAGVVESLGRHMDLRAAGNRIVPSMELFQHLKESQALIRALVRGRAMDTVLKTMHAHLRNHIEARLERQIPAGVAPGVPLPLIAHYLAGVLLSLFEWWQEHDMRETPEQLDAYFTRLVGPTVHATTGIRMSRDDR